MKEKNIGKIKRTLEYRQTELSNKLTDLEVEYSELSIQSNKLRQKHKELMLELKSVNKRLALLPSTKNKPLDEQRALTSTDKINWDKSAWLNKHLEKTYSNFEFKKIGYNLYINTSNGLYYKRSDIAEAGTKRALFDVRSKSKESNWISSSFTNNDLDKYPEFKKIAHNLYYNVNTELYYKRSDKAEANAEANDYIKGKAKDSGHSRTDNVYGA